MAYSRTAFALAGLMFAASIGAMVARPSAKLSDERPALSLEHMVPTQFGEWREVPPGYVQLVNPQTQELLDRLYSQVLSRVYVHSGGYRVMLSIAYGSDQRGALQAHKPEVCYPAQGFTVHKNQAARLTTAFGEIPSRRLSTTMGTRHEPVTYWFTVGDQVVQGSTQKRIVDLVYGLTGRIPDGMLFRVSSIDRDEGNAHRMQDRFINQLVEAVAPAERKRLTGLGAVPKPAP